MAEKLSIQIALEGGDQIAKQLADIGDAGQKAFGDIAKSAEQVGGFKNIKPDEVTAKLKEMGVTGVDAIDKIQAAVRSAGRLETLVQGITTAENALLAMARAAPIVGVAIVSAMTAAAKATIAFAETIQKASAEATKLGLTLEQFNNQVQGLEKLGISTAAATQALQQLEKAAEQVKLDAVAKAIKELEEASARGFGAQGTAQLKLLEEAAKGAGAEGKLARAELEKLGLPIPTDGLKTLVQLVAELGKERGLEAFQAQLRGMPDSLQRTNLAIAGMGPAGLQFIQSLKLAEGSLDPVAAKAETLRQATERLSTEWGKFGSLTFSPAVVQGIDAATAAVRGLNSVLTSMNWSAVGTTASVALNPLPNLIQLLGAAIVNLGSQFFGAGQAATQAGQQGAQGLQALTAAAGSAAQQMAQVGPAGAQGLQSLTAAAGSAAAQMDQFGQKGAQAGEQAAQGLQLITNPLTGLLEYSREASQALAQTGTTGTTSFGQVNTSAQTTNTTLSTLASTLAGWNWDPIAAGIRVWNDITSAIQSAIDKLLQFIGLKPSAPATGGGAPGKAGGGLLGGRGTGTSDSNLAWLSRGEFVVQAAAVRKYGAGLFAALNAQRFADGGLVGGGGTTSLTGSGGVDQIAMALEKNTQAIASQSTVIQELGRIIAGLVQTVGGLAQTVSQLQEQQGELVSAFNDLMQMVKDGLKAAKDSAEAAAQTIKSGFDQLGQQLQQGRYNQQGQQTFRGKFDTEGRQTNARGGLLGGRGTGTSDSNLAWVSRGEHIMPARAVAQPGVLAFLEALRRSGGNLRSVLDGMGRFALGGMIRGPMPAFASGGLAGGMSNVTIQFPGLPAIGGLRASSDVVDQLHRAAALAQVRSGGRKPSRYS